MYKKITEISHSVVRSALAHYKINNGAEIHYKDAKDRSTL